MYSSGSLALTGDLVSGVILLLQLLGSPCSPSLSRSPPPLPKRKEMVKCVRVHPQPPRN